MGCFVVWDKCFSPRPLSSLGEHAYLRGMTETSNDKLIITRSSGLANFDLTSEFKPAGDQPTAIAELIEGIQTGERDQVLLGVTGSGKTEVYLEAVAECLRMGRQALVLLPEIALSGEFINRVEARFGMKPAEWHSGVTMTERRRCWRMVGQGDAQMVVGARSALFLPYRDLGLIVVDEEHDTSYKQEEGVLYHARDMAVLRASILGCQVVLSSATPSLESWANAQAGKYTRIDLGARFGVAELPAMHTIDMRAQKLPADRWISDPLAQAVETRVAKGEQSLLFLNRRGFAPVTLCRACGHQVGCDDCDARMVEHRFLKRLVCHQCGATKPIPTACPTCGVVGRMAPVGPGVERLAEEVVARFPEARLAVLSSDLFTSARALKEEIQRIAQGAADIIIGTQIVAKVNQTNFIGALATADIQSGGLLINSNGFDLVSNQSFSGAGGVVKSGAGKLSLLGFNSYAGSNVVNAGELVLGSSSSSAGDITVADGRPALHRPTHPQRPGRNPV